jgi:hypothetical protein
LIDLPRQLVIGGEKDPLRRRQLKLMSIYGAERSG